MPLADGERCVAFGKQHLGQKPVLFTRHAVVAGIAGGHLLNNADAV